MDFSIIENNIGSIGVFKVDYDDVYITIMIENASVSQDGNSWFSYSFIDHKEWSPSLYGTPLNRANCCWTNMYKGWFSRDIKDTLVFIGNPQCDF